MKVEEGVKVDVFEDISLYTFHKFLQFQIAAYKHDKPWKVWKVSDTIFYSGSCANRKVREM